MVKCARVPRVFFRIHENTASNWSKLIICHAVWLTRPRQASVRRILTAKRWQNEWRRCLGSLSCRSLSRGKKLWGLSCVTLAELHLQFAGSDAIQAPESDKDEDIRCASYYSQNNNPEKPSTWPKRKHRITFFKDWSELQRNCDSFIFCCLTCWWWCARI